MIKVKLDRCHNNIARGWAVDTEDPKNKLKLDFFLGNKYVGSARASSLREDLRDKNIYDGYLGYNHQFNLTSCLGDEKGLRIFVNGSLYAEDDNYRIYDPIDESEFDSYYYKSNQAIFIHIPKAAGLSVSHSLFNSYGDGHKPLSVYQKSIEHLEYKRYFKFTIVRNPWDRFVSAFYFLKNGGMFNKHDLLWQKKLVSFDLPTELLNSSLMVGALKSCIHFKPQKNLLMDIRGELGVDYIGCFETLDYDLKCIAAILGKEANLKSTNSTKHPGYVELFNTENRARLAGYYAEDIELLGYDFDSSNIDMIRKKNESHFLSKMFDKTQGMTELKKFSYLFQTAKIIPKDQVIVEVGAYRGRSAVALSLGAKLGNKNSIYSVEPHKEFTGIYGGKFGPEDRKVYMQTMLDTLAYQNVNLVNLSSENVNALDCKVGMLWIDGDHSYEGVRRDVDIWQPRLSTNAIVVFDDTGKVDDGPRLVVNELLESELFSVLDDNDSFVSLIKNN